MRLSVRSIFALAILVGAALRPWAQGSPRVVHVYVALADNVNQGIVPVPARLGNGMDPEQNLYWGAAGGVKTYFARSSDWRLVSKSPGPKPEILERCVFKHRTADVYMVADAYRGDRIQVAIADFLQAAAGANPDRVKVPASKTVISIAGGGDANLVAYIGHDGLMDLQLATLPRQVNAKPRQVIVLACISKTYFAEPVRATGAHPLLWTTGLMAPEAYTLKSALDGWIGGESSEQIRERAAAAYDRYQKCGIKGARRLLVSGW